VSLANPAAPLPGKRAANPARPWVGPALRLRLFATILVVPAIPLWVMTLFGLPIFSLQHSLPIWGLAVLFFVTERWPVSMAIRRSTPLVGLSAAPLVLGLFYSAGWSIIGGYLVGAVLAAASRRELRQAATAFGIAQFSLFAALAAVAFRVTVVHQAGVGAELDWNAYFSVYAAAGVLILTSLTASFGVSLHDGRVTRRLAAENVVLAVVGIGASASYGMVAVDLIWSNPKGLLVLGVLGVVLVGGYRILLVERRERRVAEFLRGADMALHHSPELESAILALIGRAREMFDGQIAQLTIYPTSPGEQAYRTTVRAGDPSGTEVMVPIDPTELDDILEADSDGIIIDRSSASPLSRDILDRRHVDHAMVALLRGRTRLVGTLMVGSHLSARSFDQRDLQLFQTLAIQTSSTLENGRLEHSIARLTELQQQLSHQAFHDSLTDLANRALFSDRIEHALLRRARTHQPVAVLFIDLDDFKGINDTLGHSAGDQLLVGVADRLRSSLRRPDTAARLGGDEFAVLIEDIDHVAEAEAVAERVFLALAAPFAIAGQSGVVRCSIGIAVSNNDTDTAGGLMSHADVAMYAAKTAGKHRQVLFAPGMEAEIVARRRLQADLERAVGGDEFGVHFQPIFDLSSGRLVGTEALVRWRHPTRGMVAPDDFIRVAEDTGVILELGAAVLRNACAETVRWQVRHPLHQRIWVSVNISARQLAQPQFVDDVLAIVARSCLPPSSLVLELTESMVLEDAAASIAKLEALKFAGIRVAIDDFGTGYSSLSYLRRLPVDILKIAKPFVDDLEGGDRGDFARAIVGIGNALRLTMIAEGIENTEQLVTLRELGCHLGQGYHLSHPVIADAIDRMLDAGGVDEELLALPPVGSRIVHIAQASA
jgi:diguanylate cyclase (GGDEF)-like protein